MEITHIESFLDYYRRLRGRTMKVVACIPPDRIEWAPVEGSFSFGDILRHLGATERYVFTENACRRPGRYPGHGRELAAGHEAVLAFFASTHRESLELLATLSPDDLQQRCETAAGTSIRIWKWLRALAEHEIHHRGQLYLMLRQIGVATPPMYGLTSEEVRARSQPPA
jgi:uncharacterized damage-inducible protein DinB